VIEGVANVAVVGDRPHQRHAAGTHQRHAAGIPGVDAALDQGCGIDQQARRDALVEAVALEPPRGGADAYQLRRCRFR